MEGPPCATIWGEGTVACTQDSSLTLVVGLSLSAKGADSDLQGGHTATAMHHVFMCSHSVDKAGYVKGATQHTKVRVRTGRKRGCRAVGLGGVLDTGIAWVAFPLAARSAFMILSLLVSSCSPRPFNKDKCEARRQRRVHRHSPPPSPNARLVCVAFIVPIPHTFGTFCLFISTDQCMLLHSVIPSSCGSLTGSMRTIAPSLLTTLTLSNVLPLQCTHGAQLFAQHVSTTSCKVPYLL